VPLYSLLVAQNEAEVRHRCGSVSYARATAFQAAGHVARPRLDDLAMAAEVRGTWRRIDRVQIQVDRNHLVATCTCGTPGLCSHAGALLLQWLRAPESFEQVVDAASIESVDATPAQTETARTDLLRTLASHPLEELRQLARARNIRLTGRSKADAVAQLADVLIEPDNLDAALAELHPHELLALRSSYLVTDETATPAVLEAAFEQTGGSGHAPLERLVDLGLLIGDGLDVDSSYGFNVPGAVAARLPAWTDLVRKSTAVTPELPGANVAGLDILELLATLSFALRGGLSERPSAVGHIPNAGSLRPGWDIDLSDEREPRRGAPATHGGEVTLAPVGLLRDEDLARLSAQTGATTAAIDFSVYLLVALGLVRDDKRLRVWDNRWQAFDARPVEERHAAVCRVWLDMTSWSELVLAAGRGAPFQLRGRPSGYITHGGPLLVSHVAALRRLIARCLGLLEPNVWYDTASLLATIDSLANLTLPDHSTDYWSRETLDKPAWWLVDRRDRGRPLMLGQTADRARIYAVLLSALLQGPFAWLGLVEVVANQNVLRAFRVRPSAGVLVGRPTAEPSKEAAAIVVGSDSSVLVPAGTTDADVHRLLTRVGEFVGGSAEGLRYRLSAEHVQMAFEDGLTGPDLLRFLEDRSSKPVPDRLRSSIQRWWARYGSVRLYDELSLVELSEDVLPEEVLVAVPAVRQHLVYAISPRLLAVEPAAADTVVAELVRLGYAPRVEEGGAGT
jgi:hypothetical protein